MFGLGFTELLIMVVVLVVVVLLQWALGYALYRWTPLGRAYEGRFDARPGRFVTWLTGMVVWMAVVVLLQALGLRPQ